MSRRRGSLKWRKLSGTAKFRILAAIARGWQPGLPLSDYLKRRGRQEAAQE